jgi:8-oxo-dGTP pyrophosphatase MutT (NUDIX family)
MARLHGIDRLHALGKVIPTHPNTRPKDSASLIILDRNGPAPKVLLGRRHQSHVFMPGKFVFPGGRTELADGSMPSASELHPTVAAKLMQSASARKARALALSAIRETFEETGLMLGAKRTVQPLPPAGLWSAFRETGIVPDLKPLHFVARAITPPGLARRFDTRFFAVDARAIAHRVDGIIGPQAELVELVWVPVAETQKLDIHPITGAILDELQARLTAGLRHALPVPLYRMKNGRFVRELL